MTTVLVSPLRNTVLLAKQLATLDVLCNGRLTVGLGVGDRAQDFAAVGVPFAGRGRRFDEQLQLLRAIWTQQSRAQIGPRPVQQAGPELLIGGYSARALERLARWGDGYIAGAGLDLPAAAELYGRGLDAWTAAERSGRPRFLAARYFAFGDSEVAMGRENLLDYYQFLGNDRAARVAGSILSTEQAVQDYVSEAQQLSVDEIMFWPCSASLSQLDNLVGMLPSANRYP